MHDTAINKILVVRFSSLGDVLLTTPIIRALKNKHADALIDFVIKKEYVDTLSCNPYISRLLIFEKASLPQLREELRKENYNLVIDLQNNFRSKALTRGLSRRLMRFRKPTFKKLLLVWTKINLLKDLKTISQRYAEAACAKLDSTGLDLFIPENIIPKLNDGKKYIGFCPGSKHFTKRWLPEYFAELGNKLTQLGYTIVLFGGRADKELCDMISKKIKGCLNFQNEDDLLQTAADMKKCQLIFSNDSGLMHTASAIGASVIAIFGSTVEEFGFSPYGNRNLILENKLLSCRPCSHIGKSACPQKHFRCMKEIKPELVLDHIQKFIAKA